MSSTQTGEEVLEVRRSYQASPESVFEAWTDPVQLKNWMAPSDDFKTEAEADAQVGGRYRFQMTDPAGSVHVAVGEYRELDPPNRLVFTWSWEDNNLADGSVVTIELTANNGGCELLLRHELLANQGSRDHHAQGWNGCLARLEKALAA
jgi:glutathione S-transferase